jgi:hypothetical protein
VGGWQGHRQPILLEGVHPDTSFIPASQPHQGQIQLTAFQCRNGVGTVYLPHRDSDPWVAQLEALDHPGQLVEHGGGDGPYGQQPHLTRCRLPHHQLQVIQVIGQAPHRRQDRLPCWRKLHALGGTIKQLHPQGMLEHLDLLGQRRLSHAEAAGGTPKVSLLGHRQK